MLLDAFVSKKYKERPINPNKENVWRSLVKTISWRIVGTIDTIFISWIITGTIQVALSIGLIELASKMLLYYFHERTWNRIRWGKK